MLVAVVQSTVRNIQQPVGIAAVVVGSSVAHIRLENSKRDFGMGLRGWTVGG